MILFLEHRFEGGASVAFKSVDHVTISASFVWHMMFASSLRTLLWFAKIDSYTYQLTQYFNCSYMCRVSIYWVILGILKEEKSLWRCWKAQHIWNKKEAPRCRLANFSVVSSLVSLSEGLPKLYFFHIRVFYKVYKIMQHDGYRNVEEGLTVSIEYI